ncbi:MAG: GNAT family N-acetyltransferase, partial [Myxococcota bacterium]
WSNDPVTRSMSFRPDPIGWEEHVEWFTRKLADPTSIMFIALNDDAEVGVVRFDQRETRETISVSVAPDARGRGHAVRLIRLGCRALRSVGRQGAVDAWIQTRNVASIKSFERAGFSKVEDGEQGGAPAVRFEWRQ